MSNPGRGLFDKVEPRISVAEYALYLAWSVTSNLFSLLWLSGICYLRSTPAISRRGLVEL